LFPARGETLEREMQKEGLAKERERQILVFRLSNEELGLDLSCVREVLRPQEIYPLPRTPSFMEGVINLRGRIVALIDLRKRLYGKSIEDRSGGRIVVCRIKKFIVGLTVTSLKGILALSSEEMMTTPEVVPMQMETEVVSGMARVGKSIIPILNLEHLLTKQEVTELSTLEP
jgi:purine-binding chemotaxis protein CheW